MHRRALHFASLLLLFAALGSAEGSVSRRGEYALDGHHLVMLLAQDRDRLSAKFAPGSAPGESLQLMLPAAAAAQRAAAWTMRPPSEHSVALHAVTGSGL
jgi:hypothetical protein